MSAMKVKFELDDKALQRKLRGTIRNVGPAGTAGVKEVMELIVDDTLDEVPRDTETLAKSFEVKIEESDAIFLAEFGYGKNGDPIDPVSGKHASEYMAAVHEDLEAHHEIGKAKYFEDPWRKHSPKFRGAIRKHVNRVLK